MIYRARLHSDGFELQLGKVSKCCAYKRRHLKQAEGFTQSRGLLEIDVFEEPRVLMRQGVLGAA